MLLDLSDIRVQIAVISAISVFVTALLSLISTLVNRWYDRENKRYEILLNRRVKNGEEVVLRLDEFLKEFSDRLEEVSAQHYVATITIKFSFKTVRENPEYAAIAKQDNLENLQEYKDELHQQTQLLWDEQGERVAWFQYDVIRLSVWFDKSTWLDSFLRKPENIGKQLAELGKLYDSIHFQLRDEINRITAFYARISENSGELVGKDIEELEEQERSINELSSSWKEVVEKTASLQKRVVDELR